MARNALRADDVLWLLRTVKIQQCVAFGCRNQEKNRKDTSIRALSIQQKLPVQIFGIFAGRMARVRLLPRIRGHMLCNTGHAG